MRKKIKSYSTFTNMILFVLLLVMTPFLLLQNYLQAFIGKLSLYEFEIGEIAIPYTVFFALLFLCTIIVLNRRYLTLFRLLSTLIAFLLLIIGQKISDFYFNHSFYELQHNWHYFAYGIFSFIAYRHYKSKKKTDAQTIIFTFLTAIAISTFDEFIQIHISSRIFDIGDIGKDSWGAVIGMFFIFFVAKHGEIVQHSWKIREKKIVDYFKNPFSMLILEAIFTIILLFISSQLTNIEYLIHSIIITIALFLVFFFIWHLSQRKLFKKIIFGILIIGVIVQGVLFLKYNKKDIIYNSYGITVYKGIPLLFFDVMIKENGFFRFVDKKHDFNTRDLKTIYHYSTDILLIGSGNKGLGGNGFPEKQMTQFVFNTVKMRPLQVIILKTPDACKKYNQLKKEGYNVLFIIHNTC